MNITPHFTLEEFTRNGHGIVQTPTAQQIENMRELAVFLEGVRNFSGPIRITSGIRNDALNEAVGGAASSSHRFIAKANAADCQFPTWVMPRAAVIAYVVTMGVHFDQIIFEERTNHDGSVSKWLHISTRHHDSKQRMQALMCFDGVDYATFDANDPRVKDD